MQRLGAPKWLRRSGVGVGAGNVLSMTARVKLRALPPSSSSPPSRHHINIILSMFLPPCFSSWPPYPPPSMMI